MSAPQSALEKPPQQDENPEQAQRLDIPQAHVEPMVQDTNGEVHVLDDVSSDHVNRVWCSITSWSEGLGCWVIAPSSIGDIMLDDEDTSASVDHHAVAKIEDDGGMVLPADVVSQRRALFDLIEDATYQVPLHRLRKKTKPSSIKQFRLAYKPGRSPVKVESGPMAQRAPVMTISYRAMYYKRDHKIALRQLRAPKMQIGSAKIPAGMVSLALPGRPVAC